MCMYVHVHVYLTMCVYVYKPFYLFKVTRLFIIMPTGLLW